MSSDPGKMKQYEHAVSPFSNGARNTYVVEHITDALLRLAAEKTLREVSISELCDLAGVGRASFYRNFESKEDVLKRYDQRIVRDWLSKNAFDEGKVDDVPRFIQNLLQHYKQHQDFYTLLYRDGLSYIILDTINSFIGPQPADESVAAFTKAFLTYGLFGIVNEWVGRGMKEPTAELAAILAKQS